MKHLKNIISRFCENNKGISSYFGIIMSCKQLLVILFAIAVSVIVQGCGTSSEGYKMVNIGELEFHYDYEGHEPNPISKQAYRKWLQQKTFCESFELASDPVKFSWEELDHAGSTPMARAYCTLRVKLNKRIVLADIDCMKKYFPDDDRLYKPEIYDPQNVVKQLFGSIRIDLIGTDGVALQQSFIDPAIQVGVGNNGLPTRTENLDRLYEFFHFLTTAAVGEEYDWVFDIGAIPLNTIDTPAHIAGVEELFSTIAGITIRYGGPESVVYGIDFEGENIWDFE